MKANVILNICHLNLIIYLCLAIELPPASAELSSGQALNCLQLQLEDYKISKNIFGFSRI
jgi:hypothetical protein